MRRDAVDRVELERDERNPREREVTEQHSGDSDHLKFLLDDVATSGVRVATKSQSYMRHRYHLPQRTQPKLIRHHAAFRLLADTGTLSQRARRMRRPSADKYCIYDQRRH